MNTTSCNKLYPSLAVDDRRVAEANLDRYLAIVFGIYTRRLNDRSGARALDGSVSGSYDPAVDAHPPGADSPQ